MSPAAVPLPPLKQMGAFVDLQSCIVEPVVEAKYTGELAVGGLVGAGGAVDTGGRAEGAAAALGAETSGSSCTFCATLDRLLVVTVDHCNRKI